MEKQVYQITNPFERDYEMEKAELIPGRNKRRTVRKINSKNKGKRKYGYK